MEIAKAIEQSIALRQRAILAEQKFLNLQDVTGSTRSTASAENEKFHTVVERFESESKPAENVDSDIVDDIPPPNNEITIENKLLVNQCEEQCLEISNAT